MNIRYNDSKFRVIVSLIGSHFIAIFGYDEGMFEILLEPNYWVALLFGFGIALLGCYLVFRVTKWLDERFDWYEQTLIRASLQLLLGWVIPGMIMFLFAAGYFAFFRVNILHTVYLTLDFPVVCLLLLVMNIYYLCYYLIWHNRQLKEKMIAVPVAEDKARNIFIVHTATRSIPIKTDDIRQVFILEGNTFLRTTEMQDYQDAYLITETLKTMEELLDPALFFRVNRKMIVHIESIKAFVPGKNQILELSLSPPLYTGKPADMPVDLKKLHTVSEDRVPLFKKWMER